MALGDTYNNNEKKNYSPSVQSGYRFSNVDSSIDKTALTFSFWNKLLKVSIAPMKDTTDGSVSFNYDEAGIVYLTHSKALILYKEIVRFLEEYQNGSASRNAGVNTGKEGLIYICDGKEFNGEGPVLVLRKINENGECTSSFAYEFKRGVHSSVINYTVDNSEFEARTYDLLEIEQFATLLKKYYEDMTMTTAYSIQETSKYDTSKLNTKLKLMADKLGVEFKHQGGNSGNRSSNNSYFSSAKTSTQNSSQGGYNAPSTTYEAGSLDDLG